MDRLFQPLPVFSANSVLQLLLAANRVLLLHLPPKPLFISATKIMNFLKTTILVADGLLAEELIIGRVCRGTVATAVINLAHRNLTIYRIGPFAGNARNVRNGLFA